MQPNAQPAPKPLFDAARMRHYPIIILILVAMGIVGLIATSRDMLDFRGKPLGYDFITFWGASSLTLEGRPEAAFDPVETVAAQAKAVAGSEVDFFWHYPPPYQFVTAPLALMPYPVAFIAFALAGFAAYLFALRPLLNQPHPGLLLAAFPATIICLYHGQNSMFSVALLAGAIILGSRGPREQILAGVCIGLLAYKPQLGILIPFALAIAGQWRIFAAAAATALCFMAVSTLALGAALWSVFFSNLHFVNELVETGSLPWAKMPSMWVTLRTFGVPEAAAYAIHGAFALSSAGLAMWVWLRCGMTRLSWAVLIAATLTISHYLFDYELTLLAAPIAILMSDMAERGATRNEKLILLACIVLSGVTGPLGEAGVPTGTPLLIAMLWLTTTRALTEAKPDRVRRRFPWKQRRLSDQAGHIG